MLDSDLCWQAVCTRDTAQDGRFVFAVRSTGVYCRPNCPARRPRRENVSFYIDADAAAAAGFRPCKRCSPQDQSPAEQLDALVVAVGHHSYRALSAAQLRSYCRHATPVLADIKSLYDREALTQAGFAVYRL